MKPFIGAFMLAILEYIIVPAFAGFILWVFIGLFYAPAVAFPLWKVAAGGALMRAFLEVFNYIMDSIHGKN